jgi:hypothetical protein
MEIVENLAQWQADYEQGWLAHFKETGQLDFTRYARLNNKTAPAGPGLDLSHSRLALISSAGAYLRDTQEPFDAPNPLGDYTLRLFPVTTPFAALAYSHDHYDHRAVLDDPQVLLPLGHLADMVREGAIGELAATVISFSGYQPDLVRVVNELIPVVVEAAKTAQIDAALLVPA